MKDCTPSIIVVEDEKLIAKNIVRNIERASDVFNVVATAYDGETALELFETYLPDVIFTDIKMPVMDGLELIKKINKRYPQVKIVVLSGYSEFEYAKTAMSYNVKHYLLKPINIDELRKTLADLHQLLLAERGELVGFQDISSKSTEEIVNCVKEFIDSNYSKTIHFSAIARNVGFSQSYLSKAFTNYFGEPPSRYLTNLRMRKAKQLLKTTHLSVKQISDSLGYVDQCYFSKVFKNKVGISPVQYRKTD